jgi:hypothetical protein
MIDIFMVTCGVNKWTLALDLRWFLDVSFRHVLVSLLSVISLSILITCLVSHNDTYDHVSTIYPGEIRFKCNDLTNTISRARIYAVFRMHYEELTSLPTSDKLHLSELGEIILHTMLRSHTFQHNSQFSLEYNYLIFLTPCLAQHNVLKNINPWERKRYLPCLRMMLCPMLET